MGLDITGKSSEFTYHGSYHGLHLIRWLAMVNCGLPRKIEDRDSFALVIAPFPRTVILNQIAIDAIQKSGYFYPNLMFHSDCEGNYTKNGKIFKYSSLETGNSIKLLKELRELNDSSEREKEDEHCWDYFDMLHKLVEDEVENGKGHLIFE